MEKLLQMKLNKKLDSTNKQLFSQFTLTYYGYKRKIVAKAKSTRMYRFKRI